LKEVKVFSPSKDHRDSFAIEMSDFLGIKVAAVGAARSAVENQPIVSLATSSRSSVLEPDWIEPGALVVSITSGQLPRQTVASSRVIVSWKEELLGGEAPRQPYMAMIGAGTWSAENIAAELGEVISGKTPGRLHENQTIVFESVGMAIWDTVAAAWAYRWAMQQGVGTDFSLE
jgi:alanine dehydrogenase